MLDGFVEHVIVTCETIWENYPTLRPAIKCFAHLWRISIIFLRVLARNRSLATYTGRQPYLVCYLNINPIPTFLKNGYEVNELSLKDNGEVSSIRKVVDKVYQIHIRLYTPPENSELAKRYAFEIRSHFEFGWEYHPIRHWRAEIFKPAHEETLSVLRENKIDHIEHDRANEQLELEKHLKWINDRLENAKNIRRGRPRKIKDSTKRKR